jgi:hypothetical protein
MEDGNRPQPLSATARARFVEELRSRQNQISNATPEEREAMVREAMERAQREDALAGGGGGGNAAGNINRPMASGNDALIQAAAVDAGRMPIPSPPAAPAAEVNAGAAAPMTLPRETVKSGDESRQRFEALNEEQRRRFIEEMRKNREKLSTGTPADREALTKEILTMLEKEAGKAGAGAGTPGEAKAKAPVPAGERKR